MASAIMVTGFTVGCISTRPSARAEHIGSGIAPDVLRDPSMLCELEGIEMRRGPSLVDEHQFVWLR